MHQALAWLSSAGFEVPAVQDGADRDETEQDDQCSRADDSIVGGGLQQFVVD